MSQQSYFALDAGRVLISGCEYPGRVTCRCRRMLWWQFTIWGYERRFSAKRGRRDYVIEQIETVPMTAEQYDRAVTALATLIVEWAKGRHKPASMPPSGHSAED